MSDASQAHGYMHQALTLAERGLYTTTPNPRVGCVIVKDGKIVGEGAHLRAGEHHAEIDALRQAGEMARGADVYVTLEPCSHYGRTPPCANALIQAGVKRVIAAMQDPNPEVAGSGLALLQASGIEVESGLLQMEAIALNPGFIKRMSHGLPYVRSKIAASLDGRTALANGVSQWITGDTARADVQHWRARSCAILTGISTVQHDDPQMTVRSLDIGRQPLRVIADSRLQISPHARILQGGNALVAYASDPDDKAGPLRAAGIDLMHLADKDGRVCLQSLLRDIAVRGINEVLVEAGEGLNGSLLQHDLIDEYLFYFAPVLMGSSARGMFAIPSLSDMSQRKTLDILETRQVGNDLCVRARPKG
jgi:diaminohydroxyphosphoribosylaminopyrimidine deaminase/5-amino-6-(5-phosphoribosylamino)uracil reductase